MNNFIVCVNAVLPMFLMIVLGYTAKCLKLLTRDDVRRFNKVAFRYFLAVNLFYNVSTSDLSSAANPKVLLFATCGVAVGFLIALLYSILFVKEPLKKAIYIQGIYRSNYVIVGLPLAQSLMPDTPLASAALLAAIVVPMFNVFAVISMSVFNGQKPDVKKVIKGVATNPLIIGSLLGLVVAATGIRLPAPINSVVVQLSRCATPLMLFLLGAFLDFKAVGGYKKDLIFLCFARLIIYPAFFLSLAALLGFRGMDFVPMLGIFASSLSIATFTMAQEMGSDSELAGLVVVFTNAICSFTLFGWSFLFKCLGVF